MKNKKVNFIDVRTPVEFNSGSVPNAINVPLNELVSRLEELRELQPMLIFCAAGVRSQKAIDFLVANGVTQVENGGGWLDVNANLNKS
jgi:rhodanese-related sulfurtransferase